MSHFPFAEVAENYHNCRMSEKTANPLEQFVLLAKTAKVNLWISLEFSNSSRVPLPWSWSSRPWRLPESLSLGSCLICQMSRLPFSISSSPILHPMYKFHFFPGPGEWSPCLSPCSPQHFRLWKLQILDGQQSKPSWADGGDGQKASVAHDGKMIPPCNSWNPTLMRTKP